MRIKILIGAINEKKVGKLVGGGTYDVSDEYAKSYISNGWAEIVVDETGEVSDPQSEVTKKTETKKEGESEKAQSDTKEKRTRKNP